MNSPEVFYLHLQGEQRGPYTIPQIDHLLNSGLIGEETLYWREGLEQWQPVTSLVKIRRKTKPWGRSLLILSIVILVASVLHFFGSIAVVGWRETNQHEYTESAAYWRARGIVRNEGLPDGAIVQFKGEARAKVEMLPPKSAKVFVQGDVTTKTGETIPSAWNVPLEFDFKNGEWTGGPVQKTDVRP
jgi:hypothetical protein